MSQNEKEIVQSITEAAFVLPDEKREYILGYAEGVLAMADQLRKSDQTPAAKSSA